MTNGTAISALDCIMYFSYPLDYQQEGVDFVDAFSPVAK